MNVRACGLAFVAVVAAGGAAWAAAPQPHRISPAEAARLQKEVTKLEDQVKARQDAVTAAGKANDEAAKQAKAAADAVVKARADASGAHSEEAAVIAVLRKAAESQPDMAAAIAQQKKAQAEFDAASSKVLTPLADRPEFKQAGDDLDAARKAVADSQNGADVSPDQRLKLAQSVVDADKKLGAMREQAIDADPDARTARQNLAVAQQLLADQNRKFEESIRNDPTRVAAKQKVDAAETKLKQAEAANQKATQDAAAARVKLAHAQSDLKQTKSKIDKDKRLLAGR